MGFCGGACGSGRVAQAGPSAWGIHTLVPPPPAPHLHLQSHLPWALSVGTPRSVAAVRG